jgi:hypothetical protein
MITYVRGARSVLWSSRKHFKDEFFDVLAEVAFCRKSSDLSGLDHPPEVMLSLGLEGRMETSDLVDDTAEGPDVRFLVVALIGDLFRTHVVRSAYLSLSINRFVPHLPGETEVPNLHVHVLVQEHISRLEVSMQNLVLPCMTIL